VPTHLTLSTPLACTMEVMGLRRMGAASRAAAASLAAATSARRMVTITAESASRRASGMPAATALASGRPVRLTRYRSGGANARAAVFLQK